MKRRLDAAAKQSGRSQSQEAEFRLEQAFARDRLIWQRDRLIEALVRVHERLDAIVQLLGVQDIQRIEASAQIAGLEVPHDLKERLAQMERVARARSRTKVPRNTRRKVE
jgi:hypothetical protein